MYSLLAVSFKFDFQQYTGGKGRLEMKQKVFRDEVLEILEMAKKDRILGEELIVIMKKIKRGQHLNSDEFVKVHDLIWKDGASIESRALMNE